MNNFEPVRWRWSHYKHHGHAAYAEPLDFGIIIRKPTDLIFFFSLFVPFGGVLFFHKSLQMETIKHAMGITTEVMEHCIPEKDRSKCRNSARIHVGIWIIIIISSILYQSWLPMLYLILPKFYGNTLQVLFGLTQHAGLYEDIKDYRYSTRTIFLNPVFSFFILADGISHRAPHVPQCPFAQFTQTSSDASGSDAASKKGIVGSVS